MNSYTINSLKVMGDEDPTYGFTYWGYVHEADMPVRFSTHEVIDDVRDKGRTIYAAEQEVRKSSSGKEYLQLKKVKLEDDSKEVKEVQLTEGVVDDSYKPVPLLKDKPNLLFSPGYIKDVSDIPVRLYTGNLNYAKDLGLNLIDSDTDRLKYFEYIKEVSDELLKWTINIRGGDGS